MTESLRSTTAGWGVVPIRVAIGLVFAMHGGQKLFISGVGVTSAAMMHMGIPLSWLAGPVAIIVEFLGGLAILFGLYARWPALLMVIEMAVVILVVKLHGGFFSPSGIEFELTLLAGALTIAALGTGSWSLDAMFRRGPSA
jgi:putative oxidoreductase